MFRNLNKKEEQEFRDHARKMYRPGTEIKDIWHPVTQDECRKMNEETAGFDYSLGRSNIDRETGIHYGIVMANAIYYWNDESSMVSDNDLEDGESPGLAYEEEGYLAYQNEDSPEIIVIKSPYYTLCKFCSPCFPGAGDLDSPTEAGIKAYCFGHDFFEDGKAPYPVYDVKTDKLVEPK